MPNGDTLPAPQQEHALTIHEIKNSVARVRALLDEVMVGPHPATKDHPAKEGVHYGVIPGTKKPTLLQPGAELILMMFRLEAFPLVDDLSTPGVIRYRVKTQIKHQISGLTLGWGVGECSSDEDKYAWRRAVCDPEWDDEDPTRRRKKWFRGEKAPYQVKQVRTNPADIGNTILKMAYKRSLVSGARGATAASDVFDQDADDLSPEMRASIYGEEAPPAPPHQEPGERSEGSGITIPAQGASPPETTGDTTRRAEQPRTGKAELITDSMRKTITGRMKAKGVPDQRFLSAFGIPAIELLERSKINEAMEWIEKQPS